MSNLRSPTCRQTAIARLIVAWAAASAATLAIPATTAPPTVNTLVVNPATMPVPVAVKSSATDAAEGSLELFDFTSEFAFGGGGKRGCAVASLIVPSGKRLVVTSLGGEASASTVLTSITIELGGVSRRTLVLVPANPPVVTGSGNASAAGQAVHVYVEGTYNICANFTGETATANVFLYLSGYYVNKP